MLHYVTRRKRKVKPYTNAPWSAVPENVIRYWTCFGLPPVLRATKWSNKHFSSTNSLQVSWIWFWGGNFRRLEREIWMTFFHFKENDLLNSVSLSYFYVSPVSCSKEIKLESVHIACIFVPHLLFLLDTFNSQNNWEPFPTESINLKAGISIGPTLQLRWSGNVAADTFPRFFLTVTFAALPLCLWFWRGQMLGSITLCWRMSWQAY